MTATETPLINMSEIPGYFGGGLNSGGCAADRRFERALEAMIALSGRTTDDAALRLIVRQIEDAHGDLQDMAFEWGRIVPAGMDGGLDEWEDDDLARVTGHRRPGAT
jgi:hypothetical protein